jgi:hypothetical protein
MSQCLHHIYTVIMFTFLFEDVISAVNVICFYSFSFIGELSCILLYYCMLKKSRHTGALNKWLVGRRCRITGLVHAGAIWCAIVDLNAIFQRATVASKPYTAIVSRKKWRTVQIQQDCCSQNARGVFLQLTFFLLRIREGGLWKCVFFALCLFCVRCSINEKNTLPQREGTQQLRWLKRNENGTSKKRNFKIL